MNETTPKSRPWGPLLAGVLIALLAVEVILLIQQNRALKATINQMTAAGYMETLKPGERVAPIPVRTLDGRTGRIHFDSSGPSLLFVLSTTCPFCEKNLESWSKISSSNADRLGRVFGVSVHGLEETRKYAAGKRLGFEVVAAADSDFTQKYKIPGVPETILLEAGGVVAKTWIGQLSANQVREIEGLIRTTR